MQMKTGLSVQHLTASNILLIYYIIIIFIMLLNVKDAFASDLLIDQYVTIYFTPQTESSYIN